MGEFLIRHPHIEKLTMQLPDPGVTASLLNDENQFIIDYLPNIREMEMFEISNDKIASLSEMKNLKSVYLDFKMKPIATVMKAFFTKNTPIEKLELASGFIDNDAIKYICEIKTITQINLFNCNGFDESKLTRLIQNLPNLKSIQSISTRSVELFNLDAILPILRKKRVEWWNDSSDSFVSYVSSIFFFCIFEIVFQI